MIRHVVAWKLKATEESDRVADTAAIVDALNTLPALIPEIVSLSVGANTAYFDSNWDIALVADYASLYDLEVYQTHPEHLKVVDIVKPRVASRANVDFEL